jgi:hypothetical protein
MSVGDPSAPTRAWRHAWVGLLLALALATVGVRLQAQQHDYFMMDEYIAVAVVDHVIRTGTPDTNWARTQVTREFRYDQFNFSSYYLASAGAFLLAARLGATVETADRVRWLRAANALLAGVAVLLIGLVALRLAGPWAAIAAALLGASQVSLLQDALYARPEVFVTVLTLVLYLVVSRGSEPLSSRRAASAGAILGVLVACKISFAMLLPFVLAALVLRSTRDRWLPMSAWFFAAVGVGFAVGVPYALLAPDEYLHGIHYLVNQYATGHPPHGALDGDLLSRLAHSGRYLLETAGAPALLLAIVGAAVLTRAPASRAEKLLLVGILASGLYFLQSRAFFERNLSHALPFAFALSGVGLVWIAHRISRPAAARHALALLLLVACLWRPLGVSHLLVGEALARPTLQAQQREIERIERAGDVLIDALHLVDRIDAVAEHFCSGWAIRLDDVGDVRTGRRLAELQTRGWIAEPMRIAGPFSGMLVSTLHTYHGGDVVFVRPSSPPAPDCRLALARLPAIATGSADANALAPEGNAIRNGYPPQAIGLPRDAIAFGTFDGTDVPTGRVTYRGPLCPHQALPIAAGPSLAALRLRIALEDAAGASSTVFDGAFPTLAAGWSGLALRDDVARCTMIEVSVEDPSSAWGTWVGLGLPVDRATVPASLPVSTSKYP